MLLVATTLFSCREKNKFSDVDLSGVALDSFRFERLDIAYRDIDTNNVAGSLATLKGRYGDYLNLFSERVLNVGHIDSASTHTVIRQFLSHPEYRKIFMACDSVYKDGFAKEENEITDAFKYFKYYFPEKTEKKNVAELIIAKQRNGPTGTVNLTWLGQYTKFMNMANSSFSYN